MLCPHCGKAFPLTWARYLAAPTGKHRCPACGLRSRLYPSVPYLLLLMLVACAGAFPAALALALWLGGAWAVAGWLIGGLIAGAVLDKTLLDAGWRRLEKPEQAG